MTTRRRARYPADSIQGRASQLKLYGVLANWEHYEKKPWLPKLLADEEAERQQRGLQRRGAMAQCGGGRPVQ